MLKSFLDLFLKPNCVLCERGSNKIICVYCERQLNKCKNPSADLFWQGELPLLIWGNYGGILKQAIATLKYNKKENLGTTLGLWLGETWLKSSVSKQFKNLIVVPIPLHEEKLKQRGFNQAEIIAQGFCQITGYALKSKGLKRVKNTAPLFGLNPQQREEELKQSLSLGQDFQKKIPNSSVLLLDDIYTTGTTVKEAKNVLQKHNINVVGVIALASSKQ
jgi:ComF family protein